MHAVVSPTFHRSSLYKWTVHGYKLMVVADLPDIAAVITFKHFTDHLTLVGAHIGSRQLPAARFKAPRDLFLTANGMRQSSACCRELPLLVETGS